MSSEAQKRRPPAYFEYGSDLLSREDVRLMSLAELGLFALIRWSLWANDTLPSAPETLAKVLGRDAKIVSDALTDRVRGFYPQAPTDPGRIHSPELSDQMKAMMERRAERSESGRKGGRTTQRDARLHSETEAQPEAQLEAKPEAQSKLSEKNRNEKNRNELARKGFHPSSANAATDARDPWVKDYEAEEMRIGPLR